MLNYNQERGLNVVKTHRSGSMSCSKSAVVVQWNSSMWQAEVTKFSSHVFQICAFHLMMLFFQLKRRASIQKNGFKHLFVNHVKAVDTYITTQTNTPESNCLFVFVCSFPALWFWSLCGFKRNVWLIFLASEVRCFHRVRLQPLPLSEKCDFIKTSSQVKLQLVFFYVGKINESEQEWRNQHSQFKRKTLTLWRSLRWTSSTNRFH